MFSHESAAALWGFPVLDDWPGVVHAVDAKRTRGHATSTLVRHPGFLSSAAIIDEIPCTTAVRTAIDLTLLRGFLPGLLACDFGLAHELFSAEDLRATLGLRPTAHRRREALTVVELADAKSGSPGESISRGTMHLLGIPRPELQKEIVGVDDRTYFLDFWWPELGVGGEFDGDVKYRDPKMRAGRTMAEVMSDERHRHNAIIASPEVANLVRWQYSTARSPAKLAAVLSNAGVKGARP